MHFHEETSTNNSDLQLLEPDCCSSSENTRMDEDHDSRTFDVDEGAGSDTQSRARLVSPPPSPLTTSNLVTSDVSRADSLASSTVSHTSTTSSPDEVEPYTSNMVLSTDKTGVSARNIILLSACTDPIRIPREYQPLFPLFQPANADKLWYLGFLIH
jgi:hypothetical protein